MKVENIVIIGGIGALAGMYFYSRNKKAKSQQQFEIQKQQEISNVASNSNSGSTASSSYTSSGLTVDLDAKAKKNTDLIISALSFNDTKIKKMIDDFKVAHPTITATSNPKLDYFEKEIAKKLNTLTDLVKNNYGVLFSSFKKLNDKYTGKEYDLISNVILKYFIYQISGNFYVPAFTLTNDEQILISEKQINIKSLAQEFFGAFNNSIVLTAQFRISPLPSTIPFQK